MYRNLLLGWVLFFLAAGPLSAADDILIADFEQATYGQWKAEGEAFGPGPAQGTLQGQMHVAGFQGERLVNSFFKGDASTGKLTSPPFKVERDYLRFLIGGGGYEAATCVNLLADGKVLRTATGPNTNPGGSEALAATFWDLRDLKDQDVTLEIVDDATGGWGHINADHFVLTDQRPKAPTYRRLEAKFTVENKFLVIPIKNGAKTTELTLEIDGRPVRRYTLELATSPADIDWYAFFTIESYKGQPARVSVASATEEAFALVRQAGQVPGSETWYTESLRPQFHFSQQVGWNYDPYGMGSLVGKWHLFFQHNPVGWNWGNMTWGHAVSPDLVHWQQLPNALFPSTMARGACFSGGAVIDTQNTAGWKTGDSDVLVAFLTDTGAGESIAYSRDRGRTFTWYAGNPVVKHQGRDPKVLWYAYDKDDTPLNDAAKKLGGHWVMAVYDEHAQHGKNIAFYTSVDLKQWQEQSHLPGYFECPELCQLPMDGDQDNTRWVILAADARYAIGRFDGRTFTPEHEGKHQVHWGSYYASQIFSQAPDGRAIQIGWARVATPGMPFNQQFSFPHELTLRTTPAGLRLFVRPVSEIEKLHGKKHAVSAQSLVADSPARVNVAGDIVDVRATFTLGKAQQVGLNIGGNRIAYDVASGRLNGADLSPVDGKVSIQVLVDRSLIEICGNDGRVCITSERPKKGNIESIEAFAEGGEAKLLELTAYELKSIWNTKQ